MRRGTQHLREAAVLSLVILRSCSQRTMCPKSLCCEEEQAQGHPHSTGCLEDELSQFIKLPKSSTPSVKSFVRHRQAEGVRAWRDGGKPSLGKHTRKISNSNPCGVFHIRDELKTKTCTAKKPSGTRRAMTGSGNELRAKTRQWPMNTHIRLYQIQQERSEITTLPKQERS